MRNALAEALGLEPWEVTAAPLNLELVRRLAALSDTAERLTNRAERLIDRQQLAAAQRELRLAKQRDPAINRQRMADLRAAARAERRRAESDAAVATGRLDLANIAREAGR